jgi:hypothetical protein
MNISIEEYWKNVETCWGRSFIILIVKLYIIMFYILLTLYYIIINQCLELNNVKSYLVSCEFTVKVCVVYSSDVLWNITLVCKE